MPALGRKRGSPRGVDDDRQDGAGPERATPSWLRDELRLCIRTLAAMQRPSASQGERRAAEWVASRLRQNGLDATVETEPAHGGYWWPIGLLNALVLGSVIAHRRRGSKTSAAAQLAAGAFATAAIWDDVGGGRQWFRRVLQRRSTYNVISEVAPSRSSGTREVPEEPAGVDVSENRASHARARASARARGGAVDSDPHVILIVAHHDAAHSGLVFHPALPRLAAKAFPAMHRRSKQSVPIMYATWLGPVLAALGALSSRRGPKGLARLGGLFSLGSVLAMANIGVSEVVPGANDNLSAVGVLIAIARALQQDAPKGVRVLLLSTGSEESFMEGMQGFLRRHRHELDQARTTVLCLECLGSPTLTLLEGEGMLRMRPYSEAVRDRVAAAAAAAGVPLARDLKTVAATDALVALRRGYAVATLASVDETKFPANYHWRSDTPDNLSWETIEQAYLVTERFIRDAADGESSAMSAA